MVLGRGGGGIREVFMSEVPLYRWEVDRVNCESKQKKAGRNHAAEAEKTRESSSVTTLCSDPSRGLSRGTVLIINCTCP